jgi:hypothetical protein
MTRLRTLDASGREAMRRAKAEERAFRQANPDPRDAFVPVAEACRRQFRREVWTWRMDPARFPALIVAMKAAMRSGEPLTCDEATAITGVSPPPLDAVGGWWTWLPFSGSWRPAFVASAAGRTGWSRWLSW